MLDVLLLALAPTLGLQVPSPVRVRTTPWPSANSGAGIASDGTWVAGTSSGARKQPQAFRWGAALGFEGLVGMPYEARAISDDGQRVMARFPTPSHYASGTTAVWSPQGVRYFPGGGPFETYAYAEGMRMSRNGRYVAGWSEPGVPPPGSVTLELGWVWDTEADLVRVLRSDWNGVTRALDVSEDGRVAVGFATHERTVDWTWSPMSIQHPATWTDGEFQLLGTGRGAAWGTNDDGSFVVGELDGRAVLWERGSGARFLETLEPAGGYGMFTGFRAVEVSDDGSTARVLQVMSDFVLGEIQMHPQLWRQGAGAVRPRDLLAALGAEWPDGNLGVEFVFLGPDGRTLVGFSSSTPQGEPTGALWRALLPPAAEYYCTTQASSGGCAPRMAFTGTPSARTGAGFTIRVRDVPAGAFGVLAYGTSGAASVPFEGGTLCVAEPTTRVALGTAGGAGTCDGTLAVDFNAVVVAAGDPELVGGAAVWTQVWLRETGPQPARIASDALMFTLWP